MPGRGSIVEGNKSLLKCKVYFLILNGKYRPCNAQDFDSRFGFASASMTVEWFHTSPSSLSCGYYVGRGLNVSGFPIKYSKPFAKP